MNKIIHKYIEHHDLLMRYRKSFMSMNNILNSIRYNFIFLYESPNIHEYLCDIKKINKHIFIDYSYHIYF